MKKYFKFFSLTLIGIVSLSACNNELEYKYGNETENNKEIRIITGISNLSRTEIADGSLVTMFKANDEIGIFAYESDRLVATNVKYTYNGNSWESENAITAQPGVQYTYCAYYPYKEGITDPTNASITVNADQTVSFNAEDFLTAQNNNAEAGAQTITLNFNHAFSMVQVGIKDGVTDDTDATILLESIMPTANVNIKTGEVSTASGETTSIKMKKSDSKMEYRAIIPGQTITANDKLLTIIAANKTYGVSNSADVSYNKGQALQITVNSLTALPEGEVVTIGGSITDWDKGEVSGEIETEEIPLIKPISGTELPEVLNNTSTFKEEAWFKLLRGTSDSSLAEFAIEDDDSRVWGKAAKLTFTPSESVTNNSWYIATIGYSHTEPMYVSEDTYIYKVTAWVKGMALEDGTTAASISVTCKSRDYTTEGDRYKYSFGLGEKPTIEKGTLRTIKPAQANTWEETTFYIDFSKVGNGVASGTVLENSLESDYAGFDLRFYTNNSEKESTIYVSDVTIEPYTITE